MAMVMLPRIAGRIFNRPLAVTPDAARVIVAAIGDRLGVDVGASFPGITPFAVAGHDVALRIKAFDDGFIGGGSTRAGYQISERGVAVVPVLGELVARAGAVDADSGLLSYEALQRSLKAAAQDSRARAILLDIQSPGGEVSGMLETASLIRSIAGEKPVWAIGNDQACSAAYLMAAAATRTIVTHFGQMGSIGALFMHTDTSQALARQGVKVTLITAGAMKAAGNSYEPLAPEAAAMIKAQVERVNADFVAAVAGYRRISAESILGQEARVFLGDEAVKAGLADGTGPIDAVVESMPSEARRFVAAAVVKPPKVDDDTDEAEEEAAEVVDNPEEEVAEMVDKLKKAPKPKAYSPEQPRDPAGKWAPGGGGGGADGKGDGADLKAGHGRGGPKSLGETDDGEETCTTDADCEMKFGTDPFHDDEGNPIRLDDPEHPNYKGFAAARGLKAEAAPARPDAKARIKAILDAPEAKGREALAKHLAFETEQDVEAAVKMLAAAPQGGPTTVVIEGAGVAGNNVEAKPATEHQKGAAIGQRLKAMLSGVKPAA